MEWNPIMCVGSLRAAVVMTTQPVNPKPRALWSLQSRPAVSVGAKMWGCRWRRQKDRTGMAIIYRKRKRNSLLCLLSVAELVLLKFCRPVWWKTRESNEINHSSISDPWQNNIFPLSNYYLTWACGDNDATALGVGVQCQSLVAGVKGELGEPSVELHWFLRPGHDITNEVASAGRLAVNFIGRQDSGPELEIRQLSHEGLCDVEAASHRVLWRTGDGHVGWAES